MDQGWRVAPDRWLRLDRPRVIGIVNVTPDSFSDGGRYRDSQHAVDVAMGMLDAGAVGLDIGGESTRPGAVSISSAEQIRRVVPVIKQLADCVRARSRDGSTQAVLSVDTCSASVARAAFDAGADVINDISAGRDDPAMFSLAAAQGAGMILMHRRTLPGKDQFSTEYATPPGYDQVLGVLGVVGEFLRERVAKATAAGVDRGAIVVDPGLGFGKSVEQNLELIARTREMVTMTGCAVLSAVSRKSFTARAAGLSDNTPTSERLHASIGLSLAHLTTGARVFRVHDVGPMVQALNAAWSTLGSRAQ